LKEDHVLVRTGPYKAVRHPIYSGLLLALVGTALAISEYRAAFTVALALIGCLVRIQAEEMRMRQSFPEYSDYRKQTASLIPFLL
jgi:protein-S-isoprenylcysteine O-methyltransferase Ste14